MSTSGEVLDSCEELTCHPQVDGPFGSWPMDLKRDDIRAKFKNRRLVHNVGQGMVDVLDEKYAIKLFHYGDILKEIRMSLLAGPDCSVPVLGRLFEEHELIGFVMPYGQPLAPNGVIDGDPIPRPMLSKDEKRDIIHKICRLMERLHGKGIIHGDVKLGNFLLCSDGEVRLCDWAVACMDGDTTIPLVISEYYASSRRCTEPGPLSKAEDLYATGVSIWEIWVEETPFRGIDDELVEEVVMAGLRPDLGRVDDPAIAALIASYLDAGPPPLVEYGQSRRLCTEVEIIFGRCACDPPHSEIRIVKCMLCHNPPGDERQEVEKQEAAEKEGMEKEDEVVKQMTAKEEEEEAGEQEEQEEEEEVAVVVEKWQPCQKFFRMPIPQVDSTSKCLKCD